MKNFNQLLASVSASVVLAACMQPSDSTLQTGEDFNQPLGTDNKTVRESAQLRDEEFELRKRELTLRQQTAADQTAANLLKSEQDAEARAAEAANEASRIASQERIAALESRDNLEGRRVEGKARVDAAKANNSTVNTLIKAGADFAPAVIAAGVKMREVDANIKRQDAIVKNNAAQTEIDGRRVENDFVLGRGQIENESKRLELEAAERFANSSLESQRSQVTSLAAGAKYGIEVAQSHYADLGVQWSAINHVLSGTTPNYSNSAHQTAVSQAMGNYSDLGDTQLRARQKEILEMQNQLKQFQDRATVAVRAADDADNDPDKLAAARVGLTRLRNVPNVPADLLGGGGFEEGLLCFDTPQSGQSNSQVGSGCDFQIFENMKKLVFEPKAPGGNPSDAQAAERSAIGFFRTQKQNFRDLLDRQAMSDPHRQAKIENTMKAYDSAVNAQIKKITEATRSMSAADLSNYFNKSANFKLDPKFFQNDRGSRALAGAYVFQGGPQEVFLALNSSQNSARAALSGGEEDYSAALATRTGAAAPGVPSGVDTCNLLEMKC